MKTTVEIPDSLLEQARSLAQKEGTTIRALVEEGLRKVVDDRRKRKFRLRDTRPRSLALPRGGQGPLGYRVALSARVSGHRLASEDLFAAHSPRNRDGPGSSLAGVAKPATTPGVSRLLGRTAKLDVPGSDLRAPGARCAHHSALHPPGITEFWTADRDFSRFPDLNAVNPLL